MRESHQFCTDWQFSKQPVGSALADVMERNASDWMSVSLPHDWLIYNTADLYETGEGWYRKTLKLNEKVHGRLYSLRFEGVYMNSTLYVNGHAAGEWKYGYSTFEHDITPYLHQGNNEIYMRVVHESPNSRWYSGAGIYRPVRLNITPETHIIQDGVYVSAAPEAGGHWRVSLSAELKLGAAHREAGLAGLSVRHMIVDADGRGIADAAAQVKLLDAGDALAVSSLSVLNPRLWDTSDPYRYRVRTELLADGIILDTDVQPLGFRTVVLDSGQGFSLNGRRFKLNGVCQHHDLGCLGAAVNRTALRRQLELLQQMGVNAVRTAHNMPAVELMDLADQMGILIVSEAFDMWERSKTPYDYARFFPDWWRKDIASWVRRDRNRPSLIMWSIGNEIYDTHADERGQELTRMLMDEVLVHDPRGNGFVTIGSNYMPWENAQKCADIVKIAGYNYGEAYYNRHHAAHPDWIIYGSETCSTVQSRGVYHFPLAQSVLADDDGQCSSLGNSSTSWGAKSTEACIMSDRDAPYSLGQFLWTGFDYIGEPTPYHTKNSYFGQLDTAGFPKDSFYVYQASWTDYRERPMVHIFPYWDFSEGQLIDVRVCSNAPRVELFLNGKSQGSFDIDHEHGRQLVANWQLPYTEGVLRAVAYDMEGMIVAEQERSSFGDAAALVLEPDKAGLQADGSDLVFITVSAVDGEGRPVENANNRVTFSIEGPGRLVGLDNGDSTDYDAYKGISRRMFSGKLLAVVASSLEGGTVTLRASSPGLADAVLTLESVLDQQGSPSSEPESLYLFADCPMEAGRERWQPDSVNREEIPVRKLELICPGGNVLTPDLASLPVRVKLHPEGASYRDVEWRITNAAGIDAGIAVLEADGHEAVIRALGDGDIYVRCATRNGGDSVRLYAQMEIKLSGFGQAYHNPYAFISAGYHSPASTNLTNGNERGVATARDGESLIVFERIDFGSYGADEIELPVFALDSEEFPIELWLGIPGKPGARQLAVFKYGKPSRWNVYQEETYRLPERLTGVVDLTFRLRRKIHLKGFRFIRKDKAFEQLRALDANRIYGDAFRQSDTAVEGIGNNVSLIFEDMDFGDQGSRRLVICGRSRLANNSLHLLFSGPDGDSKQLVEFPGSDEYTEREFILEEPVRGQGTVTFLFLPGSDFDFRYFRFIPHKA